MDNGVIKYVDKHKNYNIEQCPEFHILNKIELIKCIVYIYTNASDIDKEINLSDTIKDVVYSIYFEKRRSFWFDVPEHYSLLFKYCRMRKIDKIHKSDS